MKSWILQILFDIRYSYWFIPSIMALGAVGLAVVMVALDIYYLTEIPQGYEWLFRSEPSGARAILSTVAGSTITVAGVVFSMTIMAVSHATSNYGSRLLLNFMKDRGNQIALGTFTATFIYCLLVLRTVISADDGAGHTNFVPHLAVLGALGMALASVAVLIAFIHHVPETIHIGSVASNRGQELIGRLDAMFVAKEPTDQEQNHRPVPSKLSRRLVSAKFGYLQALDVDGLIKFCAEHDLVAKVTKSMGDFIFDGEVILEFEPASDEFEQFAELQSYFGIGAERTPAQDTSFLIEELSQIAIRALSPGINDPFTAITCIDWLGNSVAHVIDRSARPAELLDNDGTVRVIMPSFGFVELCDHIFGKLKPYVVNDVTTSLHMSKVFLNILACSAKSRHENEIVRYARLYLAESQAACTSDADKVRLADCYAPSISITSK